MKRIMGEAIIRELRDELNDQKHLLEAIKTANVVLRAERESYVKANEDFKYNQDRLMARIDGLLFSLVLAQQYSFKLQNELRPLRATAKIAEKDKLAIAE